MTQHRDIERLLDAWFADGPTESPDRVIDVVTARISDQRQRAAWRLQDRRNRPMTSYARVAALAAAVIVVAVAGFAVLRPGQPGLVGGLSPSPIASSSPSASSTERPLPGAPLAAGRYVLRPFSTSSMAISLTAPAGWGGVPEWAVIGPSGTEAPGGIGIAFLMADGLFSDPCHWDTAAKGRFPQAGDVAVGPTVDDLVQGLVTNHGYTSTPPAAVTVGGYAGKQLDLQLPADVDLESCDKSSGDPEGLYFVFGTSNPSGPGLYAQGPGQRWQLRILDVDGTRLIIVVNAYADTPATVLAAAQTIVDSVTIRP